MSEIESAFLGYITEFGKSYSNMAEYEMRLTNFAQKHSVIRAHNAEESAYKLGHNKMSDWTEEEYASVLTYKPNMVNSTVVESDVSPMGYSPVDWRSTSCLSPVQDQGQCGSCWTFSTCESLSGANFIKTGKLIELSEQQIVSCSTNYFSNGAGGCNGGNMQTGYRYSGSNPIMSLADYPYNSGRTQQNGSCQYNKSEGLVGAKSYANVQKNNPSALKDAVQQQPVSISIDASSRYYNSYSSGILTNANSCGTSLDHAVIIVGWGQQNGTEFFLVKNSWGSSWGENGYVRFQIINGKGMCGCQMAPLYPTQTFMN
jgi:C1A family cysteine protease